MPVSCSALTRKIQEKHGRIDESSFTDSVIYIDKCIGEYDEPPQKEADISPAVESRSEEKQERKSPRKSTRERDGWDR